MDDVTLTTERRDGATVWNVWVRDQVRVCLECDARIDTPRCSCGGSAQTLPGQSHLLDGWLTRDQVRQLLDERCALGLMTYPARDLLVAQLGGRPCPQ